MSSSADELSTGSGREIDLAQLGIGFGVGMFFGLGLILVVRVTPSHRRIGTIAITIAHPLPGTDPLGALIAKEQGGRRS